MRQCREGEEYTTSITTAMLNATTPGLLLLPFSSEFPHREKLSGHLPRRHLHRLEPEPLYCLYYLPWTVASLQQQVGNSADWKYSLHHYFVTKLIDNFSAQFTSIPGGVQQTTTTTTTTISTTTTPMY
eukprot:Filipodium_phascolosomae@DN1194_c0_g1_i1.p1